MRRILFTLTGGLVAVAFIVSAGSAVRNEPKKANKFQSTLVGAYDECTAPNTTGGDLGLPACTPASLQSNVCLMSAKAGGKIQAKSKNGDVDIKAKIKGLTGCDGQSLCVLASARVTTDDCASGSDCTIVDLDDFPITVPGCCTVAKGKCKIKTTANTELGAGVLDINDSVTLNGCALGVFGGTIAARCGVLVL